MNMQVQETQPTAPMRMGLPQKFLLKGVGKAVVAQFTLPIEQVLIPWSIALEAPDWEFGHGNKAEKAWALNVEQHVPQPVVRTDVIHVWLANFNRFMTNKALTHFAEEQDLIELGPRECVGIANFLPALPEDIGLEGMFIVSNMRAYIGASDGRERAIEVEMRDGVRTLLAPPLHSGWLADRWFPYAKLRPELAPNSEPAVVLRFEDRRLLRRPKPT